MIGESAAGHEDGAESRGPHRRGGDPQTAGSLPHQTRT